jgi:hypothetical protein
MSHSKIVQKSPNFHSFGNWDLLARFSAPKARFSAPKPAAVTEDSKFAGSFQNCSLALRPVRHNSCLGEIKFSPRGLYIHTDTRTRTHTHTHIHAPDHSRTQLKKKKRGGGKNTKKPTCTGPTRPTNSVCVQRA